MYSIELDDFIKLSKEHKLEVRYEVVILHKHGDSIEPLADRFPIGLRTMRSWVDSYAFLGFSGLKEGRRSGRPCLLKKDHRGWIYSIVTSMDPRQLQFEFAYWTGQRVRDAVQCKYEIRVSRSTMRRAMRRLGLSPQRPKRRAYQQCAQSIAKWKSDSYLDLKKKAQEEDALILFEGEAGMRSDYHVSRTWGRQDKTPKVCLTGARFRVNMLAAITPEGRMHYMIHDG